LAAYLDDANDVFCRISNGEQLFVYKRYKRGVFFYI